MHATLIEGASTAYGRDAGEYVGWAAQLHRDSQAHNQAHPQNPHLVLNYSVPGFTLTHFNRYSEPVIAPVMRVSRKHTTRVLSVGLNEAKILPGNERPILSLARFATGLTTYLRESEQLGVQTVFIGPQPVDESRTRPTCDRVTIEDDLVEEYHEAMRYRAMLEGVPFVDLRELFGAQVLHEVLGEDGYHPNAHGHKLIHANVAEAVDETKIRCGAN